MEGEEGRGFEPGSFPVPVESSAPSNNATYDAISSFLRVLLARKFTAGTTAMLPTRTHTHTLAHARPDYTRIYTPCTSRGTRCVRSNHFRWSEKKLRKRRAVLSEYPSSPSPQFFTRVRNTLPLLPLWNTYVSRMDPFEIFSNDAKIVLLDSLLSLSLCRIFEGDGREKS